MTRFTQMGVTTAVPARYVDGLTSEELRREVQDLAEQMQPALRHYVGGTPPVGSLAVNWAVEAVDDPLQGRIHALTLAGLFDVDRLPVDCRAYLDHGHGEGGSTQTDGDPTVVQG